MQNTSPDLDRERQRRRRGRNWAVFGVLAALVGLVYAITVVKIRLYGSL